ncbi:transcriptional regulator [Streptacidiphilus sp. MAP5-3]|uniref:transcriptional regulator n=1 Tax=unclassified Streptacidiphilus TaxID=2643834 RepID=UPI0035170A1E
MYDAATRLRALELLGSGLSLNSASRATGVSRSTLREWQTHPAIPRRAHCLRDDVPHRAYSYLLGLYLGDGCISRSRRGVHVLRIACANSWPGLITACEETMREVAPASGVCRVACQGCTSVVSYSKHWPCLFPQAGPGPKHLRRIELAPWQSEIVDEHPWELIRGLVHSDGCRITNWTTRRGKRYEYPRYFFTNVSDDIRRIYTDALDRVGIEWKETRRGSTPYNISVARRESVQLMDVHVGPKF